MSPKPTPPIVIVSGASGSGKTTLCRKAASDLSLHYAISHTTRPRRPSEKPDLDYHFVSASEFDKMLNIDEFLEWADVYGNRYGTSRAEVFPYLKKGEGVILDVDWQGALQLKKQLSKALMIFVTVPSLDDLSTRLNNRGTDSPEVLKRRLGEAKKEESYKRHYDHVLVNEDLEKAFEEFKKLIHKRFCQEKGEEG